MPAPNQLPYEGTTLPQAPIPVSTKGVSRYLNPYFLVPAVGIAYLIYNKKTRKAGYIALGGVALLVYSYSKGFN